MSDLSGSHKSPMRLNHLFLGLSVCADCHLPGTLCMWTDCTTCFESCASAATECGCLGGAGEAGLPLLLIMALIVLGLFTVIGIFYSVLVATMVGQRIWQRHYHILAKRMLTKVSPIKLNQLNLNKNNNFLSEELPGTNSHSCF